MKKMIPRPVTPMLILMALAVTLTACGGGGAKSTYAVSATTETTAAYEAPAMEPMAVEASYDMAEYKEAAAVPQENSRNGLSMTSPMASQPLPASRKLIRTIHLSVETTQFDQLIANISQMVSDAGGYIESSDISGTSISDSLGRRYGYLTVRVPADRLDHFVTLVGEQGNITNKSENTQDVTLQYSDVESRKKSLTIEQERLWQLLEKADTMESIIALEERLSEIRYELESFESQLRTYDNQIDYSTVSINIDEVRVLTPTTPDSIATRIQKGFTRNLKGVCTGLVNFFVWFLSSLPSMVLLAVILLAIGLILRLVRRITPGKSGTPGSPNQAPGTETGAETAAPDASPSAKKRWFHK